MQCRPFLTDNNSVIAAAIGAGFGLMVCAKGEVSLIFSLSFGLSIGACAGWLGSPGRKVRRAAAGQASENSGKG